MVRLDEDAARRFLIALKSNSVELVASELEEHKLKKSGCSPLSNENLRFLTTLLGIASAMSWQGWTFEESKVEIIERVAGHVDIFKFSKALANYTEIKAAYDHSTNTPEIPSWLHYAIILNGYDKNIATKIQQLDRETLKSLLVFISESDDARLLDCRFSIAIARAIHENLLVSDDVLFMMFAGNLCARPYRAE